MSIRSSVVTSVVGALAVGLAAVGLSAGPASAGTARPAVAAPADAGAFISGSGTLGTLGASAAHLTFTATRTGSDPSSNVTGYFTGALDTGLLTLAGKVTCLDVEGNRAGFLYPADYANPSLVQGLVVFISLEKGQNGAPDKAGFVGPAPAGTFQGCAPSLTPLDFTGDLTISDQAPTAFTPAPPAPVAPNPAILAGKGKLKVKHGTYGKAKVLTTVSGKVTVAIAQYVAGKKSGKSCLPASGKVSAGKRCKALKLRFTAKPVSLGAGAHVLTLPKKGDAGATFGAGRYQVTFTLKSSSGVKLSKVAVPLQLT